MATKNIDAKGLKCPQPVLKLAAIVPEMKPGDLVELVGDCPTIEDDVRKWAARMKKTILAVNRDGNSVTFQIQF